MQSLFELSKKNKKNVIGLMSGTSLDGVDVALIEIEGNGVNTKVNLVGFLEYPFPDGLKEAILKNSRKESSNVEEICRLNFLIPKIYTEGINKLCNELNIKFSDIDLIGSHGQTIHHLPDSINFYGENISSTLQIGDPSVLAKLTNTITVGDFRTGDIALGGQGAPLVPYFDYILFKSPEKNRALLNIGGISNFTILNKNYDQEKVLAFDTGPGNMIIDFLVKKYFDKNYDEDGAIAESGNFNEDVFSAMVEKDSFIKQHPPKSTGRELYGSEFIEPLLDQFESVDKNDWMHTATKFTAYAVYKNYKLFIKDETVIDELIVSGGGANNKFLLACLNGYFGDDVAIKIIDEIGISADAKEAICFAVLANETISGNTTNIPRTTGAIRSTILGKICLP
jgi:anhydro-N-acetylmuramic acid kinase